jgi:RND family efflux transporter MFP subunit
VLQTTGAAEAVVQIPSTLVAQSGRIEPISTDVTLDAAPGVRIPAEIAATSGQADPTTQTFEVRFSFMPPDDLVILPGMTGSIESRLAIKNRTGGTTDQLTVPLAAIVSDGEETFVWLVDSDTMTVTKRLVTIAASVGADLTIAGGLEPGDVIVGAGGVYLFEGMKVRPYEG